MRIVRRWHAVRVYLMATFPEEESIPLGIPVNQYETMGPYHYSLTRVEKAREPFIAVQTESENGRMEAWRIAQQDSDDPEFLFRQYDDDGCKP